MSANTVFEAYLRVEADLRCERETSRRRLRLLRGVVASVEMYGEIDPALAVEVRDELEPSRGNQLHLFREGAEDSLPPAA